MARKVRLPLDCICQIALLSIPHYRTLLVIPRFARRTLRILAWWQQQFIICIDRGVPSFKEYTLNGLTHSPILENGIIAPSSMCRRGLSWQKSNRLYNPIQPNGFEGPCRVFIGDPVEVEWAQGFHFRNPEINDYIAPYHVTLYKDRTIIMKWRNDPLHYRSFFGNNEILQNYDYATIICKPHKTTINIYPIDYILSPDGARTIADNIYEKVNKATEHLRLENYTIEQILQTRYYCQLRIPDLRGILPFRMINGGIVPCPLD
jgi:hypothetical protein